MPKNITSVEWQASDIPSGLAFDTSTGTFSGTPAGVGEYTVPVTVTTNYGTDTKDVTVKAKTSTNTQTTQLYGIRIDKNNSDPYTRVEYLYDAVGKTPAHMNFDTGEFDYGDWGDVWFVKDNKPLMLKSDGTVDYYLNPNNYLYREDGKFSSVASTSYGGNAMAQIPLVWIKRYEDEDYYYEIVSNTQYDADFKAYAHTRADGTIADYFYYSMFGGSGDSTKIRSLSGQTRAGDMTVQGLIDGAGGNGSKWYIHTWSQRECIRTLLILMGKSTDTQTVYGKGNICGGTRTDILTTGTLKDKGQFWGSSAENKQVKVFHIEAFWGEQWTWTAGLIANSGTVYAKMTPEGSGYRVTDVTGYTSTGVTFTITSKPSGYIKTCSCSEYGIIAKSYDGSTTTYFPDYGYTGAVGLRFLQAGVCVYYDSSNGGAFAAGLHFTPSYSHWFMGGGLSCEMP